jgi:hypothetical protein
MSAALARAPHPIKKVTRIRYFISLDDLKI